MTTDTDPVRIIIHFDDGNESQIGYDDEQYAHLTRKQTRELISDLTAALDVEVPPAIQDMQIRVVCDVEYIATN